MAKPALAIVGAGGHGFVVAEAAVAQGAWSSIAFYDDDQRAPQEIGNLRVQGTVDQLRRLAADRPNIEFIVAIGANELRISLGEALCKLGLRLATVIHPSAVISSSVDISVGTVVLAGAVVNGRSRIGSACILNTRSSVDHDCILGNGVHISPGATLGGGVQVGSGAWIGIGACVIHGRRIGSGATIGAGSAVITDIAANVTAVGCPARVLGSR